MVRKIKICITCSKNFSTTNSRRKQCVRCKKEKKQENWKKTLNRFK